MSAFCCPSILPGIDTANTFVANAATFITLRVARDNVDAVVAASKNGSPIITAQPVAATSGGELRDDKIFRLIFEAYVRCRTVEGRRIRRVCL
mmetsp:Transcript_35306/g.43228  ORF Transcript_35306/g.43228 Transcript_35306/m.43228 type:complete len:93 (-) Transcript_35306:44-322(-)